MTGTPDIIQHYSAETAPRGFFRHALPMFRYPRAAWESRELVWNFFRRELLGRFRGSLGGIAWVLVQPIFQFFVYFVVFGILFGQRGDLLGEPSRMFAIYLFAGIILFNAISEGTSRALDSVVANGNLVRKVVFPCELLPLTPVLISMVVYLVSCAVLVLFGLLLGQVHLGWELLAWPVVAVCLMVFAAGLGLFLAAAQVFARDVQHLYGILSLAWFFLSPVFWDARLIAPKAQDLGVPWVMDLMVLNPAACLLLAQRQVFGVGATLSPEEYVGVFPLSLGQNLLVSGAWALLTFFIGYGFFMSRRRKFADLV